MFKICDFRVVSILNNEQRIQPFKKQQMMIRHVKIIIIETIGITCGKSFKAVTFTLLNDLILVPSRIAMSKKKICY